MRISDFTLPALAASLLLCGCATMRPHKPLSVLKVDENWFTANATQDNVDSPAIWRGDEGKALLVVTAKSTQRLDVYDPFTGASLHSVGTKGEGLGQFSRPNGIWISGNLLLIVERDNRRVQAFHLPDFKPLGSFGEGDLGRPYGLCVTQNADGTRNVYVTDNYKTASGGQVAQTEMGHRVRLYQVKTTPDSITATLKGSFGDTTGAGVLNVVESICADEAHGRLLVADEDMSTLGGQNVKVYTLDGKFTGKTIGDGLYRNQPEGIALLRCSAHDARWQKAGIAGRSYFFCTDQGTSVNYFHIFDAETLAYLGSVELAHTLNTDGIWIDDVASEAFPLGAFYAVDSDHRAGATGLDKLLDILRRKEAPQEAR